MFGVLVPPGTAQSGQGETGEPAANREKPGELSCRQPVSLVSLHFDSERLRAHSVIRAGRAAICYRSFLLV